MNYCSSLPLLLVLFFLCWLSSIQSSFNIFFCPSNFSWKLLISLPNFLPNTLVLKGAESLPHKPNRLSTLSMFQLCTLSVSSSNSWSTFPWKVETPHNPLQSFSFLSWLHKARDTFEVSFDSLVHFYPNQWTKVISGRSAILASYYACLGLLFTNIHSPFLFCFQVLGVYCLLLKKIPYSVIVFTVEMNSSLIFTFSSRTAPFMLHFHPCDPESHSRTETLHFWLEWEESTGQWQSPHSWIIKSEIGWVSSSFYSLTTLTCPSMSQEEETLMDKCVLIQEAIVQRQEAKGEQPCWWEVNLI